MDSYDPDFNPDNQGAPAPPAYNDPDMGYIHNDQPPPPPEYDPNAPAMPGVDAGVYDMDDAPAHPGYDDDVHYHEEDDQVVYGDDDPHYGAYPGPDGDVPHQIGGVYADENGNYGDGFDDDDDVYLDNHRIDPADIRSADPKDSIDAGEVFWRNCIGCCLCFFLICGLIILGIRVGEKNNDNANKIVFVHGNVGLVPPPPELATKCSHERVLSEKGFYECELLCEAADCCNYPTTLALSCLAGNDDECLEYHQHCSVLELDTAALKEPPAPPTNLPEAPKDIENKCNIESLRTVPGFEGCVNDCMQAECCWKKDGTVHPCTSLAVCSGYASCLTMDVTDHVNININKEIDEKCADDMIATEVGRNQCVFACSHAACCFDPGATCPHDDARFCSQYQPCQKIFDDNGQVIEGGSAAAAAQIPVAPQFLDTACAQSSMDTLPGFEMCRGACTEAECCWKGDATCLGDSACEGYHHCVSLLEEGATDAPGTDENSFPEAPQYLAAACSNGSLDTNAGFQMCQDACMKAECCWKVTSCSERAECTSYSTHCANLVARLDELSNSNPATATLPEAPHDLDQACAPANILDTDGFSKCEIECQKTECCWKVGNPNSCVSNDQCQPWAPCTVMNGAQDPTTAAAQDYSLEQVFDACLNHDNNVGGNHTSLCQVVCQAGTCCFDNEKDCPNTVDCKTFEPCAVIHTEKTAQVEAACAPEGDLADCVGVCAAATCCFTNDIAKICDIAAPDVICRQYKACEVLYQAETTNP